MIREKQKSRFERLAKLKVMIKEVDANKILSR